MKTLILSIIMVVMAVSVEAGGKVDWDIVIDRTLADNPKRLKELKTQCTKEVKIKYPMSKITKLDMKVRGGKTKKEYIHFRFLDCITNKFTDEEKHRSWREMSAFDYGGVKAMEANKRGLRLSRDPNKEKDDPIIDMITQLLPFFFLVLIIYFGAKDSLRRLRDYFRG